jgi:hypothetical protein
MTDKHINREIATETFEYGNHTVTVEIRIRHTNQYNSQDDIMNGVEGYHYYRFVYVSAEKTGQPVPEVRNRSSVAVDVEREVKDHWLFGTITRGPELPDIPEHVEYTVRPVLKELDELYEYAFVDTEIDIEVAMERVEHEMSWVEVDDEVDRISREIDSMVGESE